MTKWEYLVRDGVILNIKGELVDISKFADDYLDWMSINDVKFRGSFYELSKEEIDTHFRKAVLEV